jgi:ElaB/YqjD/DUF883 family membrane-anchored ribosome-binding protein
MNESSPPVGAADVPWPARVSQMRVSATSTWPGGEPSPPAAVDLLNTAVEGAHHTIDRFADSAAPAVRQLGESVAAAKDALHAKSEQWRESGEGWANGARSTIRSNPLVCVAAAFAIGVVVARRGR